jgi:acetyl esterase/lipase
MTAMDPREILTRPALAPDVVVRYGPHPEHLVDVHLPAAGRDTSGPAPVAVLLHGGFWRQEFDRTHLRPMAEALAVRGYVVATPEFRRSGGDGGWPMTFRDVRAALGSMTSCLDEAAPGRADPESVVVVGHSAGGHLAIWACLQPEAPRVGAVVALAPVADLYEAYRRGLGDGAVVALMGGGPDDHPEDYAAADAAHLLTARTDDDVPVVVVHGSEDDRVPADMSRALRHVDYRELPGIEHFGLIDPRSRAWADVLDAIGATRP